MNRDDLQLKFGRIVRQLRLEKGLSQEEFAALCGVHRTYIGTIERGEKTVTIFTAYRIARTLNISLSSLVSRLESEIS